MPVGPVNLWVAYSLLNQGKRAVFWFLCGVIVSDLAYVTFAFLSYFFWSSENGLFDLGKNWTILSGLFVMVLGIFFLVKNQSKIETITQKVSPKADAKNFLTGLVLCASNAMLFVMWIFFAGIFASYGLILTNSWLVIWVVLGVLIGDILWFVAFVKVLEKGKTRISPSFNYRLQKILAIALVIFGLFTACSQL